jgi:GntR family transcriptional regulator
MMNRMKPAAGAPAFRPLYQQIKTAITQSLISGEWRPGAAIPSETELAARYGVSQGTVRKAINELAAEHLLIRHQGKGTFVASHTEENRRYYFTRIAADRGAPQLPEPRLLHFSRVKADNATARLLGVSGGTSLFLVRRALQMASDTVLIDEVRLPAALFKGLSAALLAEHRGLLYSTYETAFGVRVVRADERIKAVAADAEAAGLLGVAQGAPLLNVERIAYTYGDRPVELRRSLCDTRDYHYRSKII